MIVQKVTDKSFGKYGRVLNGYAVSGLLEAMRHTKSRIPVGMAADKPYTAVGIPHRQGWDGQIDIPAPHMREHEKTACHPRPYRHRRSKRRRRNPAFVLQASIQAAASR